MFLAHSQKQPTEEMNIEEILQRTDQRRYHSEKAGHGMSSLVPNFSYFWDKMPGGSNSGKGFFLPQLEGMQSIRMGEAWQE